MAPIRAGNTYIYTQNIDSKTTLENTKLLIGWEIVDVLADRDTDDRPHRKKCEIEKGMTDADNPKYSKNSLTFKSF